MNNTFIAEQAGTFALTVALGLLIGALYDFQKALRVVLGVPRRWYFLPDLLFWLLMSVLVFLALLAKNWGEVRFYVFLGLGSGLLIYSRLFTGPVYLFMLKNLSWIAWLFYWLIWPAVVALRLLLLVFFLLGRGCNTALGGGKNYLRKLKAEMSRKKKE